MKLKAPFPYFGGKSTIAHLVWEALGNVKMYLEPFFGSGAVLLQRSNYNQKVHLETINDKCAFICNVWRALQFNPDEVAKWCDWPVNHADLSSRKAKLIENENYLLENLISNPEWYDAKIAGYWIWAASCWIGSGLTSSYKLGQIPHIADGGRGVHKLGKIPHIADGCVQEPYNVNIYTWFRKLSERLRYVRVVCGEWTRICNGDWQDSSGVVGFFFDPPYGVTDREISLYHHDSIDIAKDVLEWCKERGKRSSYRIVLCGYEEYQELIDNYGWRSQKWKAVGGYGNQSKDNKNRHRETVYFSPHCVNNTLWK